MIQPEFKIGDKRRVKSKPGRARVHKPMGMSGDQVKWALIKHPKWALERIRA